MAAGVEQQRADQAEALIGWAAMILAQDLAACQALLAGVAVTRDRLHPDVLTAIGETADGPPITMSHELALRVEVRERRESGLDTTRPDDTAAAPVIELETWRTFEQQATENVPCIIEGLWPVGALGFIAAPPKKGKTWIGLGLALSVATGKPALGTFKVPDPQPVLYLALEGHRAALRGRIGCLARGLGLDPDSNDLQNLHLAYKPRGLNIADPLWADAVVNAAMQINAGLVVVDVLRAAALIKENSQEEFGALRRNLLPLVDQHRAIALLHHFGKLTEITKERTPGERMSGSGAMYGAMDVGVFITGSDEGARKLRLEFELRDLAEPDLLGLHLVGNGTAENGGFGYRDSARWEVEEAPDEADVTAPAAEIAAWVHDQGGEVTRAETLAYFGISDQTLYARIVKLRELFAIDYIGGRGKPSRLIARPEPTADPDQLSITKSSYEMPGYELATQDDFATEAAPTDASAQVTNQYEDGPPRNQETQVFQGKHGYEETPSPVGGGTTPVPDGPPPEDQPPSLVASDAEDDDWQLR